MTRVQTPAVAAILGLSARKIQAMVARGELPGTARIGHQWTYDADKLRRYAELQKKPESAKLKPAIKPSAFRTKAECTLSAIAPGGRQMN